MPLDLDTLMAAVFFFAGIGILTVAFGLLWCCCAAFRAVRDRRRAKRPFVPYAPPRVQLENASRTKRARLDAAFRKLLTRR